MRVGDQPYVSARPDRIFVSVDASTGRSTISFAPPEVGPPFQREGDADGAHAMRDAQAILARYPGATIHGPHFHAAPASRGGRVRQRRRQS
ncbi:MAG TPA: hypothetical protein VFT22_14195 [Kofleriaceae bacterium]|nr:hypothetical protein [Kofleriaceae bacterium]